MTVLVIGIAGHPASGKDTAADFLAAHGFSKYSGGDVLRTILADEGRPGDRDSVRDYVAERRSRLGNWYPAEQVADAVRGDAVVVGFRNEAEVAYFRGRFGADFRLWGIREAPVWLLYERARGRGRVGDDVSLAEFTLALELERANDAGAHAVDRVLALAELTLTNAGTVDVLHLQILLALLKLGSRT